MKIIFTLVFVQKLPKFDLYPEQIVVIRGTTNANGSEMIAEELYENGSPTSTTSSVRELRNFSSDNTKILFLDFKSEFIF